VARLQAVSGAARAGTRHPGAMHRPCPLHSPKRHWKPIWQARCSGWPAIRRMAWRQPWRASGGRSWPATREFSRSARDAEKPALELDPTRSSRLGSADRRKEGALSKRRRDELVPRTRGQTDDGVAARAVNATDWEPLPGMVKRQLRVPLLLRRTGGRGGGDIALRRLCRARHPVSTRIRRAACSE
jgi:hypothetical protein